MPEKRTIDVNRKALASNDEIAEGLRSRFAASGTLVLNLISAPGSGKTELLFKTCERLKDEFKVAAISGDVQTALDAARIERAGIPSLAIETHGGCHLSAAQVLNASESLPAELDILFIENVGNLVCPSSFDLGEDVKVALVSLPEGDDKPAKYPSVFRRAEAFVVTKMDLAGLLESDRERMARDARTINPSITVFELSARSGDGLDQWCQWLRERVAAKRA